MNNLFKYYPNAFGLMEDGENLGEARIEASVIDDYRNQEKM